MMYHLQVDGKVVRANITRAKAFEYFDLLKLVCEEREVSVITTKERAVFQ